MPAWQAASLADFENVVVRAKADGSLVRLKDVGRVELGAQSYIRRGRLNGKPAVIIAIYTLIDAAGVRASGSPAGYVLWLFVLDALPFPFMVFMVTRAQLLSYATRFWLRGLVGGVLSAGAYGIALWAMTRAPVAAVAALRETSVIFAALIGAWLLKEGHVARRVAGAVTVAAGVVALKI